MFDKLFSLPYFIISLAIGLLFVYLDKPSNNIIYVYPTPENINQFEYKDTANNCFAFKAEKVKCPNNDNLIHNIPIQSYNNSNNNN